MLTNLVGEKIKCVVRDMFRFSMNTFSNKFTYYVKNKWNPGSFTFLSTHIAFGNEQK